MANLYRVITRWTGPQVVGGGVTVLHYFAASGTPQQAATVTFDLWDDLKGMFHTSTTATVDAEVQVVNEATGAITDVDGTTTTPVVGTAASDPLPNQTQALFRLRTGQYVTSGGLKPKSHEVRGRIFLPSMVEVLSTNGVPDSSAVSAANAALSTWIATANSTPVVFSRTHNLGYEVTTASMWTKWASLRSRRD